MVCLHIDLDWEFLLNGYGIMPEKLNDAQLVIAKQIKNIEEKNTLCNIPSEHISKISGIIKVAKDNLEEQKKPIEQISKLAMSMHEYYNELVK